ncbi:PREDICTED: bactericidal permeability-increasing protein-like [Nipponia nippon]|uniref:bactericidal permeability-increasing protein-like n=1 Tax=Nipponia nippon TaxID=128390 RepID=UPI000510F006|nr:PREDICTED: bactericidal permeability-increasing protein-like [Nipponia nippon]
MSSAPASRSRHHPQGTPGPAWLCLLLLLTACLPAAGTNPGIKARLTRRALEFGRQLGLELLQSRLQKEHELNLNGSYHSPLLGTLTYAVPRIHIHELQINDSAVDFAEDVGVRLTVQRARIRLGAEWEAQLGAFKDRGSIELRMNDLAVVAVLGVSVDGSGRPVVWSAGCDARGTDLHMEFHRGHSWLYNLLAPLAQRVLRQELNKQLCLELRRGVYRLEAALKHTGVSTQLDSFAAIDHSLLGPPAITAEHGDVALKGEFFRVGKCQQRPCPALPVALPVALPAALPTALPAAHEPMLLLAVTEFVANSAAFAYFTAGALRRNISSNMLPQRFPLQLRTKSLGVFSPQLQERYPDQPMELHLSARRQPLLSCHPDALHGALFSSAEAFVVLPNATRVPAFPAFLLNMDANVTGKPTITGNRLGGTVSLTGLSVAQVTSHVGPVEVKRLETLLKFGLWLFGVPWANRERAWGGTRAAPQQSTFRGGGRGGGSLQSGHGPEPDTPSSPQTGLGSQQLTAREKGAWGLTGGQSS